MGEPIAIESVTDLLSAEFDAKRHPAATKVVFRGHGVHSFKIIPKVYRNERSKQDESKLLSELISEVPEEFTHDKLMLDQLVRAQHHRGLPD